MAAGQALDVDLVAHVARRDGQGLVLEVRLGVQAAGAADAEFVLVLGVEVEEDVALQEARLEGLGAGHARLLVVGHEDLDGAVLDALVLGDGHRHGDAHAVVGAERGANGGDPFAVDDGLDRVLEEIVDGVRRLLRHHVHVALEHDALAVLKTGSGGDAHDHVAGLVGERLDLVLLGPVEQVLAHDLLMLRGARAAGKSIEVVPDNLRFQIFDGHSFMSFMFLRNVDVSTDNSPAAAGCRPPGAGSTAA